MKHYALKVLALLFALSICFSASGCQAQSDTRELSYSRINGKNLYYISDQEKSKWERPLTDMMKKAFLAWEEQKNSPDSEWTDEYDETAIAVCYSCGLLDVTMDGTPELLIYPLGYSGSSGTVTYFIYDIDSSQFLGTLNGGNGDTLCFYYDTQTDCMALINQYWLRYGWNQQEHFVDTVYYSSEKAEYENHSYFQSLFQSVTEHTQETDTNGNTIDVYNEAYCEAVYYIEGEKVTLEEYHSKYARFLTRYIRIPETALVTISWRQISDQEDSDDEKIEKMVDALITSDQKFLKP